HRRHRRHRGSPLPRVRRGRSGGGRGGRRSAGQPGGCAMTQMPFYVSPEQLMKDRADFARKGIARGRSVVVLTYDKGILFVAENHSRALHKISEIYDRIGFAAVGKYNEFENLRVAGIRYADLRGYSYDRSDVTARGLANAYAQTLGTVFTQDAKPYEVEIVVAEVGESPDSDQIYRLTYDGSVADEHGFVAMGGATEPIEESLRARYSSGLSLAAALILAVSVLGADPAGGEARALGPSQLEVAAEHGYVARGGASERVEESLRARYSSGLSLADALSLAVSVLGADPAGGEARSLGPSQLEVAVLDRGRPRRTFRRIVGPLLE